MIDAHTHLDRFAPEELTGVLARAAAAGVAAIVTVGMDPASSEAAVALARRHPPVRAAVGIHPWLAADHASDAAITAIERIARSAGVVAIGEIGLDYAGNLFTGESYAAATAQAVQRTVFQRQLRLAAALALPVIVHVRGAAHADAAAMLAEAPLAAGVVIQLLSGAREEDVHAYLNQKCYLSVGGQATDPRETALRDAVGVIPLDRLVLETDAPYVPPVWKGELRSEPADLPSIANYVAALSDRPVAEVVAAATDNASRFYRLAPRPSERSSSP